MGERGEVRGRREKNNIGTSRERRRRGPGGYFIYISEVTSQEKGEEGGEALEEDTIAT